MEFKGSWDTHLALMEFAYNNNYQASIEIAPIEAVYGRKCRTPVCWDEVGERRLVGPELVQITSEKVKVVRDNLKIARDRQRSYADNHSRDLQFEIGDRFFLKISPWKGVLRFGSQRLKCAANTLNYFLIEVFFFPLNLVCSFRGRNVLKEGGFITPRPDEVHSTCNCKGAYVHQVPL